MTATWIADALRAGGCRVDETVVPDWRTRGHTDGPTMATVVGVMGHHTAGAGAGDLPSLGIVRDGRSDLAGPLANLMLSRAGVWVPIAAGRCWHAGAADKLAAWPWIPSGDANGYVLGVEAESAGTGDWTAAQLTAYPLGVAALLRHQGLPAARFLGHKEWAPSRKVDPRGWPGDMAAFRTTVTAILGGDPDMQLTDLIESRIPSDVDPKTGKGRLVPLSSLLENVQYNAWAAQQTAQQAVDAVGKVQAPSVDATAFLAALKADPDAMALLGSAFAKAVNDDAARRLQA